MSPRASSGFTLIELMIVVAIIGLLAAVAVPVYQTYAAKSQVARVMSEAAGLRSLIEACINEGKLNVGTGTNECDPGAVGSSLIDGTSQTGVVLPSGQGVPQVTISPSGEVTVIALFGNNAASFFFTHTLTWQRSASGNWSCTTTVDSIYRPKGCDL